MAYPALSESDVRTWDNDYDQLVQDLAGKTNDTDRANVTARMQSLATKAEERMVKDMQTVAGYFNTHRQNVDRWLAESQKWLKEATAAASDFKKKPKSTELPPQIRRAADSIARLHQSATTDSTDFGQAWIGYRTFDPGHLPTKNRAAFKTIRSKSIDDQKAVLVKMKQIAAAEEQTRALLAITGKAAMKQDMKKTGSAQRDISVARQAASALDTQMTLALAQLKQPGGMVPQPGSISTGAMMLKGILGNKNMLADKGNLSDALSTWKNTDAAYKVMVSRVASMEKTSASQIKGFRSNEVTDATVKADLAKVATTLKLAKADLKKVEKDYAASKKAIADIQAKFKNKK